jgi:hypothetical protein
LVVALVHCVVGVRKAVLEAWEDAFDAHECDLVLDPTVKEIKDKGPDGFKVLVFHSAPADLNHL